jgi:hypothetical protein
LEKWLVSCQVKLIVRHAAARSLLYIILPADELSQGCQSINLTNNPILVV